MDDREILLRKLTLILLKLQSDILPLERLNEQESMKLVNHCHVICWLIVKSVPWKEERCGNLIRGVFQVLTGISKLSAQRHWDSSDTLVRRILESRIDRRRSVDLSECSACQRQLKVSQLARWQLRGSGASSPTRQQYSNLDSPVLRPQHVVQHKLGPLRETVDENINDVKQILAEYAEGKQAISLNDRERLRKQLVELDVKKDQIEEIGESLAHVLNMEKQKKKERLNFVKMLREETYESREVQTDLSMYLFYDIKRQISELQQECEFKDLEIQRLTNLSFQQVHLLENLTRPLHLSNVSPSQGGEVPTMREAPTMRDAPTMRQQQTKGQRRSVFVSKNEPAIAMPDDAIMELRDHLKSYMWLRLKAKELVSTIGKALSESQTLILGLRGINAKQTVPEQIKQRAIKAIETLQELLKLQARDQVSTFVTPPLREHVAPFLKLNLPSIAVLTKQLLHQEAIQQARFLKIPFYDPAFDPEFLDGGKLVLRVRVIDGQEVIEECVMDAITNLELRSRLKPIQQGNAQLAHDFLHDEGFTLQGIKMKKPTLINSLETEWWVDEQGRRVRLLSSTADFDIFEIVEDNEGENPFRKERVKQLKVNKKTKAVEEKWEYMDEQGQLHIKRIYEDDLKQLVSEDQVFVKGLKTQTVRRKIVSKQAFDTITEEVVDEVTGHTHTKTMRKEKYGQDVIEISHKDRKGVVQSEISKRIVQERDNELYLLQTSVDAQGRSTQRLIKKWRGAVGQEITEERITDPAGLVRTVRTIRRRDFDGKEEVETVTIDENGEEVVLKQREFKNEQGIVVQYQEVTNSQATEILLTHVNAAGQRVEEISKLDLEGNVIETRNLLHVKEGEIREKRKDLGSKVVVHTVSKSTQKRRDVEEVHEDSLGNQTKHIKQFYRKNNADVEEVISTLPNGQTLHNVTRTILHTDGSKLIEEERKDQFGQKSLIKTKITIKGDQVVEEFKITMQDSTEIVQRIRSIHLAAPPGTSELQSVAEIHFADRAVQTMPMPKPPQVMLQLCSKCKRKLGGPPVPVNKARPVQQITFDESNSDDEDDSQVMVPLQPKRPEQPNSKKDLDQPQPQDIDLQMFRRLSQTKFVSTSPQAQQIVQDIKRYFSISDERPITIEDFRQYMAYMRQSHQGCGADCRHLQRFYEKLGVLMQRPAVNREALKMQYVSIHAKKQVEKESFTVHK